MIKYELAFVSTALTSLFLTASPLPNFLGNCAGTVVACKEIPVAECTSQKVCFVAPDGESCAGIATACMLFSEQESCEAQKGCEWVP